MYITLRTLTFFALLTFTLPVVAAEVSRVTLDNGATVKLNDDFTWEYVILESQSGTVSTSAMVTPAIDTAKVDNLTSNAIVQAALLKSTAKAGVKVSFQDSQWDDDSRLGLIFELSSNSSKHYVMIELEISLFADSGALIKKKTAKVWQAIFRMPDSYLRNGETRNSPLIWFEGINKAQWTKQLMSLKIREMDSRM
ncbi:DUF3157 family protein [Shewanella youngdeokensis]|uniref:DUF3157 family protein n=1 Tax=Shewanella youngdeokensis TaxID=2999068 RepID=A0ABZ0K0E9_9GAMM|nr:DUF3157 family protein [Shewanella sp. DAU334]